MFQASFLKSAMPTSCFVLLCITSSPETSLSKLMHHFIELAHFSGQYSTACGKKKHHLTVLTNCQLCGEFDRWRWTAVQSNRFAKQTRRQCSQYFSFSESDPQLTPSTQAVPNCCCSKGSAQSWSNQLFLIYDILALWRSVLSARVPVCQKLKMVG